MNKVILMGRLTRDPEVRTSQGAEPIPIAYYTLAVDRRFHRDGEESADFLRCVAFRGSAEFAEKYLRKGTKIVVVGRIQTGSYTNREGQKVYTTDIIVEEQYFAESKAAENQSAANASNSGAAAPAATPPAQTTPANSPDGFMNIPDGIDDELPFN